MNELYFFGEYIVTFQIMPQLPFVNNNNKHNISEKNEFLLFSNILNSRKLVSINEYERHFLAIFV